MNKGVGKKKREELSDKSNNLDKSEIFRQLSQLEELRVKCIISEEVYEVQRNSILSLLNESQSEDNKLIKEFSSNINDTSNDSSTFGIEKTDSINRKGKFKKSLILSIIITILALSIFYFIFIFTNINTPTPNSSEVTNVSKDSISRTNGFLQEKNKSNKDDVNRDIINGSDIDVVIADIRYNFSKINSKELKSYQRDISSQYEDDATTRNITYLLDSNEVVKIIDSGTFGDDYWSIEIYYKDNHPFFIFEVLETGPVSMKTTEETRYYLFENRIVRKIIGKEIALVSAKDSNIIDYSLSILSSFQSKRYPDFF